MNTEYGLPSSWKSIIEIYMDDCKARIRPTTYKGKEDIIAVHIMPYFKNLKVNEIQPMNVRRWQTELMNNQKNYKPTYLRTLNSQLSAIFNFAVKYYGLSSNPVQKSGTIGKKNSGLEQIWTADEFKFFIDAVSDKLQSKVIFNLLYWTGMRSGEMLALTLNDFDFEERTVSITKNYARIDGEDLFLDPKTPKSNRKITLPQFVCDMVKDYRMPYSFSSRPALTFSRLVSALGFISTPRSAASSVGVPAHSLPVEERKAETCSSSGSGGAFQSSVSTRSNSHARVSSLRKRCSR